MKKGLLERKNKTIRITNYVNYIYGQLYLLELQRMKDSIQYQETINYLNGILDKEKAYYEKECFNEDNCLEIMQHLKKDFKSNLTNNESIMQLDYRDKINRRIIGMLETKLGLSYSLFDEYNKSINLENKKTLEMMVMRSFLLFLQEYIDNNYYRSFRNQLVKAKYNMLFINKELEEDMQKVSFDVKRLDNTELDENLIGNIIFSFQIEKLMEIKDVDYDIPENTYISLIRQCLCKSALLLMNDDKVSKQGLKSKTDCVISEFLILEAINKVKQLKKW